MAHKSGAAICALSTRPRKRQKIRLFWTTTCIFWNSPMSRF